MFRDVIDEIYITHIHGVYSADTFLPVFESDFVEVKSWSAVKDPCRFVLYRRK
jgi:dihydrofolate reductase